MADHKGASDSEIMQEFLGIIMPLLPAPLQGREDVRQEAERLAREGLPIRQIRNRLKAKFK